MSELQIGIVGAGHLGKIHARLIGQLEGVTLVSIADPSPLIQRELIESTDVPVISDYRKLVGAIDAAVIATPTRSHFEIAEDLLSQGIHCLIEKPITDCPYQARQLVELAAEKNLVLSVGHVEQFNPAIRFAMEKVGTPKFIQACRASGYTYRSTDIGVVHDLMIHDIDLVNSFFPGTLVKTAACGFNVFGDKEDMAQARLEFDCGGVANLTASRSSFEAQRSLQIFGTDGFAAVDLANHSVKHITYPSWMKQREFDFSKADMSQREFVKTNLFSDILPLESTQPEKINAILAEQQDWVNCILNGSQLHNSGELAAEAVRIAGQVLERIEQHQWFVDSAGTDVVPFSAAVSDSEIPSALRSETGVRAA